MDAIDIALLFARAVEAVGGTYFVGGSLASSLQGEPRSTNDIDVVVEIPLGRVDAFVSALGPDFEVDVDTLRDALRHGRTCNIFYLPAITKVDVFGVGPDPFDEIELSRRRAVTVRPDGTTLVLKTPEDTVLRKLMWFRAGGEVSDRQWRDIVAVLRVGGATMDHGYLDTWAKRLSVEPLLARARADAAGSV